MSPFWFESILKLFKLGLGLVSDLTTALPRVWSHKWCLAFTVCREHVPFSSLQQGQLGVSLKYQEISKFYLAPRTPLFAIPPCPEPALCSTPVLSDKTVYSGHVGWSVRFSRASCFAAVPECLFLFQVSRDLFGLGICLCEFVCVCGEGKNLPLLVSVSHEAIGRHQTLKRHTRLRGRLGFRSDM